jgi:hypothetical protein
LERIEAFPNGAAWCPEKDGLAEDVEALSRRLFGITDDDTTHEAEAFWDEDRREREWNRWEENFALLYAEGDEAEAQMIKVFRLGGWDVTDPIERDAPLLALDHLGRQLVCAIKGLRGARLPGAPLTDEQAAKVAKDWGAALAADASRFTSKRR